MTRTIETAIWTTRHLRFLRVLSGGASTAKVYHDSFAAAGAGPRATVPERTDREGFAQKSDRHDPSSKRDASTRGDHAQLLHEVEEVIAQPVLADQPAPRPARCRCRGSAHGYRPVRC